MTPSFLTFLFREEIVMGMEKVDALIVTFIKMVKASLDELTLPLNAIYAKVFRVQLLLLVCLQKMLSD